MMMTTDTGTSPHHPGVLDLVVAMDDIEGWSMIMNTRDQLPRLWSVPLVALAVAALVAPTAATAAQPRRPDGRALADTSAPAMLERVEGCADLRAYVTDALVDSLLANLYGPWWDIPWSGPGGGRSGSPAR